MHKKMPKKMPKMPEDMEDMMRRKKVEKSRPVKGGKIKRGGTKRGR